MNTKIAAARLRAEASFKAPKDGSAPGPLQAADAVEQQAVMAKTARLKAMRLAKEDADRATGSVTPTAQLRRP